MRISLRQYKSRSRWFCSAWSRHRSSPGSPTRRTTNSRTSKTLLIKQAAVAISDHVAASLEPNRKPSMKRPWPAIYPGRCATKIGLQIERDHRSVSVRRGPSLRREPQTMWCSSGESFRRISIPIRRTTTFKPRYSKSRREGKRSAGTVEARPTAVGNRTARSSWSATLPCIGKTLPPGPNGRHGFVTLVVVPQGVAFATIYQEPDLDPVHPGRSPLS